MYLDEYLTKPWLSAKDKKCHKISLPLNPMVLEFMCTISECIYCVVCTDCQVVIQSHNKSLPLYITVTKCSQNYGRLNRLFEVLQIDMILVFFTNSTAHSINLFGPVRRVAKFIIIQIKRKNVVFSIYDHLRMEKRLMNAKWCYT